MKYQNLQDLINGSQSSRDYFLSLPVALQLSLHGYNESIRTAADLHRYTDMVRKYDREFQMSETQFKDLRDR